MRDNFHPFQFLSVVTTIFYILTLVFLEYVSWEALKGTLLLLILEVVVVLMTFCAVALFAAFKLWAQFRGDISGTILPRKSIAARRTPLISRKKKEVKE